MTRKEIPNTLGFTADEEGNIYDPNGCVRTTYLNGDGYTTASVKMTDGKWVTYGVQRLVALAHIPKTKEQTEVNHRNGVIANNRRTNLEWVTAAQNNIHSEIMREGNLKDTLLSRKEGKPHGRYRNAKDASEKTGIKILDIWDSVKDAKPVEGLTFHHIPHTGGIPEELKLKHRSRHISQKVKLKHLDTGKVTYFNSLNAAAMALKTTSSGVYAAIPVGGRVRILQKKYQVAYADQEFPVLTKEQIERAKRHGPKPVIAYNNNEKKFVTMENAKEFIQVYELSRKAVTYSLAKGIIRNIGGWLITYRTPENVQKLKALIAGPAANSAS